MTCTFIFPECQWDTYEGHKKIHLFDVGEPIPVAQKKRKASNTNLQAREKIAKVEPHSSTLRTTASPLMPVKQIPTEVTYDDANSISTSWPDTYNSNPLGLSIEDCVTEDGKQCSDWEREPEDGFLVLLDEEDLQVIDAKLTSMPWKLYKVDVPVPSAPNTTGLSDRQYCLDPRLA